MSANTVRDILRATEQSITERFRIIEELLRSRQDNTYNNINATWVPNSSTPSGLEDRIAALEQCLSSTLPGLVQSIQRLEGAVRGAAVPPDPCPAPDAKPETIASPPIWGGGAAGGDVSPTEMLETNPMEGLVVQLPMRLDMPTTIEVERTLDIEAQLAAQNIAMGEGDMVTSDMGDVAEDSDGEIVEEDVLEQEKEETEIVETGTEEKEVVEETEEAEEETEEVVDETEEAEEEEAVELEEFEYRGNTYYRDADCNVFTTDEEGELVSEPIGVWSEAKQKILVKKPAA